MIVPAQIRAAKPDLEWVSQCNMIGGRIAAHGNHARCLAARRAARAARAPVHEMVSMWLFSHCSPWATKVAFGDTVFPGRNRMSRSQAARRRAVVARAI